MDYYLDKRSEEVLQLLLYANHYITVNEIATHLNVSKRTIYYEINKINSWFSNNGIPPIVQQRQKGIILTEDQRSFLRQEYYLEQSTPVVLSPQERYNTEICMMLVGGETLYIENFAQTCDVSRNTIINDFKQVTKILNQYNLTTSYSIRTGYTVVGDVFKKRALFFLLFPDLWTIYMNNKSEEIIAIVEANLTKLKEIENKLNEQYVSDVLPALAVFITEMANKEESLQFFNVDEAEITETQEYELIDTYFPDLITNEKIYVSLHLLGSRIQTVPVNIMNKEHESYRLAQQLVEEFEKVTLSYFANKEELIKAITAHLHSSMYRYRYGIQLGNPMLNEIKNEYSELFEFTKRACKVLEKKIGFYISDAEIAYLTLHFGAYLISRKPVENEFKILVICNSGAGTSAMIKNEVMALVPQANEITNISLQDYDPNHNYDVVISTIYIKEEQNLVKVHPILTDLDRIAILRKCMYAEPYMQLQLNEIVKIASKYMPEDKLELFQTELKNTFSDKNINTLPQKGYGEGLLYYLNPGHIQVVENEVDWEQAIHISASSLLMDDVITQSYIDSIIRNQKNGYHMFLNSDIVLAHSSINDGVKKLGISMATFKKPVPFLNEKQATIIITLAAENQTEHIQVLNDILKIFQKKKNIQKITDFNKSIDIYSFLQNELNS